jgi:hypothetical protein
VPSEPWRKKERKKKKTTPQSHFENRESGPECGARNLSRLNNNGASFPEKAGLLALTKPQTCGRSRAAVAVAAAMSLWWPFVSYLSFSRSAA